MITEIYCQPSDETANCNQILFTHFAISLNCCSAVVVVYNKY